MLLNVRLMRTVPRPDDRPHFPDTVTEAELQMELPDMFAARVFADVLTQIGERSQGDILSADGSGREIGRVAP